MKIMLIFAPQPPKNNIEVAEEVAKGAPVEPANVDKVEETTIGEGDLPRRFTKDGESK